MSWRKVWLGVSVAIGALLGVDAAYADPVTSSIMAAVSWLTSASIVATVVRTIGMSLLAQALSKKPKAQVAGVKTQTSTGGSTPQTFILGKRATSGQLVTPLDSYGVDGKTPNAFLTYVVALGCIPGQSLSRLVLNDEYVPVAGSLSIIGGSSVQGYALGGIYSGNAWLRFYDGSQTTVDPLLDAKLNGVDRPWTSDMVGKGICYAVLVFRFNREVLNSPPSVRFELSGIPLYDPRLDTTVGGSGAHRWGDPATYATNRTTNPAVMIYNLHRGIRLPELAGDPPRHSTYGGEAAAEDLPLDVWFAAMNACDEAVGLDAGGTEPRFTAGLEVSLADEPADVMEALENACQAQQVEIGGAWKIRIGGPAMPVAFFTDDDILIDHDRTHDMFPGLAETHNGIQASHPLPSALWEMTAAPPRFNADWEEADDDRRLIADLQLPAVYSPTQAQRIMKSAIEEERRFRRHALSLGPYGSILEPLDTIAWTSASEGYTSKVFEVTQVNESLRTLNVELGLRERDSADFSWDLSDELPWVAAIPGAVLPVAQAVPGLTVSASSVNDGSGAARRPAILIQWDGSDMPDVRGIMWEVRVKATGVIVTRGSLSDITSNGVIIAEGILPLTTYQVRALLIVDRPTTWTAWADGEVTTLDLRIDYDDLASSLITAIETPLDEILKTNLQFQTYKQIQDALNYTGDGRSLQFVALEAINKGETAIDTVNLIGVMAGDMSAFQLDTAFVKIAVPDGGGGTEVVPMAGFITTTYADIAGAQSSITEQGLVIAGLSARYSLKVENVGSTGAKAVAGMVFEAADTSTIGFFAGNFFIADNTGDTLKYPFVYTGGQLYLNTDVRIDGDLVVTGTVTTDKLVVNAITSFGAIDFGGMSNVSTETTVGTLVFNPDGGRARVSFRVTVDNPGSSRFAIRIKVKRNATNISGSLLWIGDEAFSTICSTYVFDNSGATTNQTYTLTVQTVTGTNIGDTGGSGYNANVGGGNLTIESFKR